MKFIIRRLVLGVGAALVVGGWGLTRFASEQRQAAGSTASAWWGETPVAPETADAPGALAKKVEWAGGLPAMSIFLWGVMSMGLGAGLMGWTIPRPQASEYGDEEDIIAPDQSAMRIS